MVINLKPLHRQVIFITGATSGIGLATVKMAVERGAKVFMVARNEDDLQLIQDEMRGKGYETAYAVADVAEVDQIQFAADRCLQTFGRIDTFINNAGVTIEARAMDTSIEEAKRLFDTNFWGVVNGCKVAIPILKDKGGALINIGSVLSYVGLPVQGIYSASKHAVRGFTDALRRELLAERAPIQVTLIVPSAVKSSHLKHSPSHVEDLLQGPPVYETDVVAKAILKCCEKPTRELGVGASSFFYPFIDIFFSRFHDFIMSNGHDTGHVMKSRMRSELSGYKGPLSVGTVLLGSLAWMYTKRLKHETKSTDYRP